jgi:site-specific recombinase XerD
MLQLELWASAEPARLCVSPPSSGIKRVGKPRLAVIKPMSRSALDELVLTYVREARAKSTRLAYSKDWRSFEHWCEAQGERALPASSLTLSRYLAHLAQAGRKASTIRRARISISVLHGYWGAPRPDRDDCVRTLERGIGRTHGNHEENAAPLLVGELERVLDALEQSPEGERDRALLLLGFAGAYRASELVGLDVSDLEFCGSRLLVHLRRSKEDQLGHGATTELTTANNPALCPVGAMRNWLKRVGRSSGVVFYNIDGRHAGQRIGERTVTRIVQRAAARAGLVGEYSAHSLRAGFATSAFAAGASDRAIQLHGRWKDRRSLDRYIHVRAVPQQRNVISRLL